MRMIMSQNGFCSGELSLHGKTNNTEHDKPNYIFYLLLLSFIIQWSGCETRSLYGTFVELFKPPSVTQTLQNPLFCGSTGG